MDAAGGGLEPAALTMHIVIIGNGIAGVTAARHIRKLSDHRITMISDETMQPFSRTALMYVFMGQLKQESTHLYEEWFWDKNRIGRVCARVRVVQPANRLVLLDNGAAVSYDRLIVATGSLPAKSGVPGEGLPGVQHLYHLNDLDTLEHYVKSTRHAVVVGGGLTGIELVEMLLSRNIRVTFLVRETGFMSKQITPEESSMVARIIREHGADLRLNTALKEIKGENRVASVVTTDDDEIPCELAGITIGVSPAVGFLACTGIETDRGILVDENLATSVAGIYAAGDCAQLRAPAPARRAVEPLWYTARAMGEVAARNICGGAVPYIQGIWCNSARFFDTEYQIYGCVPAITPDDMRSLYWEHRSGRKSVRINYETATGVVAGIQTMGIRYRQQVCEQWIGERAHITNVLAGLQRANFDPEFSRRYEAEIAASFQHQTAEKP